MGEPTEEELMRRRDAIRAALSATGLALAAPVIDAAARADWEADDYANLDATVTRHAFWFTWMPAHEHLALLARDFTHVSEGGRVYLAGITGETLANVGDIRGAMRWMRWANEHMASAVGARWLHARNTRIGLDAGRPDLVRESDAVGSANHAIAQAMLGYSRNAYYALEHAKSGISSPDAPFSVFSFPEFQWHMAGSEVHTRLGNTATARDHQREALEHYPASDVLDRAVVNLDVAECFALDGRRDDARQHLSETMATLPRERHISQVTTRAGEVARTVLAA